MRFPSLYPLLLCAALPSLVSADVAHAQSDPSTSATATVEPPAAPVARPDPAVPSADLDLRAYRLQVSGWSLVGLGVTLPTLGWATQGINGRGDTDDEEAASALVRTVAFGVAGAAVLSVGGALLLRRRLMLRRRRLSELSLVAGLGCLRLAGRF